MELTGPYNGPYKQEMFERSSLEVTDKSESTAHKEAPENIETSSGCKRQSKCDTNTRVSETMLTLKYTAETGN